MKTLTVSHETFNKMILGLIQSGVTFEAKESDSEIVVTFTGGH